MIASISTFPSAQASPPRAVIAGSSLPRDVTAGVERVRSPGSFSNPLARVCQDQFASVTKANPVLHVEPLTARSHYALRGFRDGGKGFQQIGKRHERAF
jgi:hypothetical protein